MNSSEFVPSLIKAMPTPGAKLALLSCLSRWQGQTVYVPIESKARRRQRAAKDMLANGMEPPDIARALCARFGISSRTAFRDVSLARKMS